MAVELSAVIGTIVKMSAPTAVRRLNRSETVIKIRQQLHMDGEPPADDFKAIYAHSLVEYGVSEHGVTKPEPLLNFFRHEPIREAFRRAFDKQDPSILAREAQD